MVIFMLSVVKSYFDGGDFMFDGGDFRMVAGGGGRKWWWSVVGGGGGLEVMVGGWR